MEPVKFIVFRYLTQAEFFNIYKPAGTEARGGGQAYIDFPITAISLKKWRTLFSGASSVNESKRARGPCWQLVVNSIGLDKNQPLVIYQRRKQSVSIAAQKITSKESNRVFAWHPINGFPQPADPKKRTELPVNLGIFIVRTEADQFWAGWFKDKAPCKSPVVEKYLGDLLGQPHEGHSGFTDLSNKHVLLDTFDKITPFCSLTETLPREEGGDKKTKKGTSKTYPAKVRSEEEIAGSLFEEDEAAVSVQPKIKEKIRKIRSRNVKAVKALKELYQGKCQLTGEEYTFIKKDGLRYSEAHHLVPLGNKGADSPYNIIIVSPLIHRMLHHANVSEIDFSRIKHDNTIPIEINGKVYTLKWHPKHFELVKKYQQSLRERPL